MDENGLDWSRAKANRSLGGKMPRLSTESLVIGDHDDGVYGV